jgi:hypothetical protein
MTTRPSGTNTRSTSRKVACGSALNSSVCGSTTRSRLASGNGSAAKSVTSAAGPAAREPEDVASHWCGMRLVRSAGQLGQPELKRVVAKNVGHCAIKARLLPSQQVAPGGVSNQSRKPIISALMTLIPLPAFTDNYIWMLHDGRHAVVVDPGDAGPVMQALTDSGLTLQSILVTHHHPDHVGGVDALRAATGARVLGRHASGSLNPLKSWPTGMWCRCSGTRSR